MSTILADQGSAPGTATSPAARIVTVVTPVYNEAENLANYAAAVRTRLMARTRHDVRVLFVDDGSTDGSWKLIQEICREDRRFHGIRLSRNFGSHAALSAGLAAAEGDAVATLACDLQDPPEAVVSFLDEWERGAQIVWGKRKTRAEEAWRIWTSRTFFRLIQRFAMPKGSRFTTGSFLLMDAKVLSCFRQFQEHNRITFALVAWTGFEQAVVPYDRAERTAGVSGWSFSKMLKAMYDVFVAFSTLPVRLINLFAIGIAIGSAFFAVYLLLNWLFADPLPGWTTVMLAIAISTCVQFLVLGVLAQYLHRIYVEVARRPLYFISDRTAPPVEEPVRQPVRAHADA